MSGAFKGGGLVASVMNQIRQGRSQTHTGIDPNSRMGTNRGGSTTRSPGRRGRGGVGSSAKKTRGPGPAKTPLSY